MKLQTRLVVVLLAITVLLSAATVGGLELYKQEELDRSEAAVEESASVAAAQISSSLDERADYIGYVASRPTVSNFSTASGVVDGVVANSRFFAVQVIRADGTVVAFDGQIDERVRAATIGSDVSDEAYFRDARYRGATVSDPEYVESRDQHLVVVSAPILQDGRVVGVLAASIYVSSETFLNPVASLARDDQRVTVRTGDELLYESRGRFERTTTGEATVEPYGWTVAVERNRAPLDVRIRTLGLAQGVGLVLVLLLVGSLWVFEHRNNLRQTQRLLDGFAALRDGDYDRTLDLQSAEEWSQISEGFNVLADGLADRESAVREREQRLSVLSRVLRHNVRNEMNVVLGYAELLTESDDPETRRAAETILERGNRLVEASEKARWLDKRFDVSDPETFDLVSAIGPVVEAVAEEFPDADVSLAAPASAPVSAVPDFPFAVRNLVENACDHSGGDPTVSVRVEPDGDEVHVTVADDGPGIPKYERVALLDREETALEHGSGVGLWVTKWLVSRSDGRVAFETNDPQGSVVTLSLPAATDD